MRLFSVAALLTAEGQAYYEQNKSFWDSIDGMEVYQCKLGIYHIEGQCAIKSEWTVEK